jgi:hypothetical protein
VKTKPNKKPNAPKYHHQNIATQGWFEVLKNWLSSSPKYLILIRHEKE